MATAPDHAGGAGDAGEAGEAPDDALVARRVEQASGALANQAVARMHRTLPWFADMSADHRAGIGLVVQAGIASFVEWCRRPEHARRLSGDVFRVAPRELVRAVSLERLVDLVRVAVETVEAAVPELAGDLEHEQRLRADVLRYSRDIAFAGAAVYARAAEERGAWDARLEALVVDHVVRGETDLALPSRAAAVGWGNPPVVAVMVGIPPAAEPEVVVDDVHRLARTAGLEVLTGVHTDRLVVVVGGRFLEPDAGPKLFDAAHALLPVFAAGPVVVGPPAADLPGAAASARAAIAAAVAVRGWPGAPRPVAAAALLPERALGGDADARRSLVEDIYIPLRGAGKALLDTVTTYLDLGSSLEATARAMFLHPNTVRYRLRKAAETCGLDPAEPRDGFTLHVALVVGRLSRA